MEIFDLIATMCFSDAAFRTEALACRERARLEDDEAPFTRKCRSCAVRARTIFVATRWLWQRAVGGQSAGFDQRRFQTTLDSSAVGLARLGRSMHTFLVSSQPRPESLSPRAQYRERHFQMSGCARASTLDSQWARYDQRCTRGDQHLPTNESRIMLSA